MAKVVIDVNVAFPGKLHSTLKSQETALQKAGAGGIVLQGVDSNVPNRVIVCMDWKSVASARSFWESPAASPIKKEWCAVESRVTVLQEHPND